MRSDVLIVASRDRLARIECRGGIQARHSDGDTVHLVSTAATPLGGDTVSVRVIVEPGARLRLRSVAATVALPGHATPTSESRWDCVVGGHLDVDLEPTIVATVSRHLSAIRLEVADGGRVRWRERVQIGRHGEGQGFWSGSLHADAAGKPLLRHRVELGSGSLAHDELDAPLAYVSELRYPDLCFDAPGTRLALAGGGSLVTWQGPRLVNLNSL